MLYYLHILKREYITLTSQWTAVAWSRIGDTSIPLDTSQLTIRKCYIRRLFPTYLHLHDLTDRNYIYDT